MSSRRMIPKMRGVPRALCFLIVAIMAGAGGCRSNDTSETLEMEPGQAGEHRSVSPLKGSIIEPGKHYRARIHTEHGEILLDLLSKDAPYTASNFIHLARAGFYDGLTFFKVVPGFVAQAGDPTGTGRGGPGYMFADESNAHQHNRGMISMAHAGKPNSNGSQFFICLSNLRFLDGKHTIFGRVTGGMDVVDQLVSEDEIQRIEILTDKAGRSAED